MNETNNIIGFHLTTDPHGCFSNWYHSWFTYAGVRYNCVEQYMMAHKVAMGRRYDLYEEIMNTSDPNKMKSLAGKDSFPEYKIIKEAWENNRRHIVKQAVKAKFIQNSKMLEELLETGTALLAECARHDKVWGIGINLNDPEWHDPANWKGDNYLGIILMEVRDELRKEIQEKGEAQYIDFRNAPTITEWKIKAGQLKRVPQYYSAIHAYADQLSEWPSRDYFYQNKLSDIEYAMNENMGGGLPVAGFYEMKQEVYEIARDLRCQIFVSDILRKEPNGWATRGAPFFWKELQSYLSFDDLSMTTDELKKKVLQLFKEKTGEEATEESLCFVEEYSHGGMSSGYISGDWILNFCIPLLQKRLRQIKETESRRGENNGL